MTITVYGKATCDDTLRSRALLEARAVDYDYRDVEHDPAHAAEALRLSGVTRVPVIDVDGSVLVEPSDDELAALLELR